VRIVAPTLFPSSTSLIKKLFYLKLSLIKGLICQLTPLSETLNREERKIMAMVEEGLRKIGITVSKPILAIM